MDERTSRMDRVAPPANLLDELPTSLLAVVTAPPVFVDDSGRRRRTLAGIGSAVAVLCVIYLSAVLLGVLRGADNPLLGPVGGLLPDGTGTAALVEPGARPAPAGDAADPVVVDERIATVADVLAPVPPALPVPLPAVAVPGPVVESAPAAERTTPVTRRGQATTTAPTAGNGSDQVIPPVTQPDSETPDPVAPGAGATDGGTPGGGTAPVEPPVTGPSVTDPPTGDSFGTPPDTATGSTPQT